MQFDAIMKIHHRKKHSFLTDFVENYAFLWVFSSIDQCTFSNISSNVMLILGNDFSVITVLAL